MNTYQANPSSPSGTTSTAPVMAGLGASYTPSSTGDLLVIVSGTVSNSATGNNNGAQLQIAYDSTAAPNNGDAATGNTVADVITHQHGTGGGIMKYPFSIQSAITGLTLSTAYWFDLQFAVIRSGTANIENLTITIIEN